MTTEEKSEFVNKLPFMDPDNPPTSFEVTEELVTLVGFVSALFSAGPTTAAKLMTEPGEMKTQLVVLQTRLSLALEGWLSAAQKEVLTSTFEGMAEAMDQAGQVIDKNLQTWMKGILDALENQGYLHTHAAEASDEEQ